MSIINHLFGWKESSFEDYQLAYATFGGNVLSNPRILRFFHSRTDFHERFFTKQDHNGELMGGVCVWDNRYIAGDQRISNKHGINRYPINFDEIVLPVSSAGSMVVPFRTKFLSDINHRAVRNSSHLLNARREVSIVRDVSAKSRSSRLRELRKFLDAGGSIHVVTDYDPEEVIQIYAELFFLRRGKRLDLEPLRELLHEIPDLLFGYILNFKGVPCAMQWVVKSEGDQRLCLDYVNAGMNTSLPQQLSVGTLAAWVNVRAALDYGEENNKQIRFSFGRPTAAYKDRWCDRNPLYRVIA